MYDLKRRILFNKRFIKRVSVAEPAMYDLKHDVANGKKVTIGFQLLNQQCMI